MLAENSLKIWHYITKIFTPSLLSILKWKKKRIRFTIALFQRETSRAERGVLENGRGYFWVVRSESINIPSSIYGPVSIRRFTERLNFFVGVGVETLDICLFSILCSSMSIYLFIQNSSKAYLASRFWKILPALTRVFFLLPISF